MAWIHLVDDKEVAGSPVLGNESLGSIKCGKLWLAE
jgi:hypothetical protein